MTREALPYHERDYVLPERFFYPSEIPVKHNQLRHLISSPSPNIVYFAELGTIYRLNTRTRKKACIASLSFEVRCTASGHGWFCAGGEKNGHFAAIRLPEERPSSSAQEEAELDVADFYDPWLRSMMRRGGHGSRARFPVHEESLGTDIVNSISIHRILIASSDGREHLEPVAVITQNDNYVRLYHLGERKVIWRSERFDVPMNHATISPDGRLMFIVGDIPVGYIYERVSYSSQRPPCYELLRRLSLHALVSTYFTTAWSGSGRLCATASEHGYLLIFDTEKIRDPEADPVVVVVPASRATQEPGAIRTMSFAPAPWDFLLWTENHGRMCIANLRDNLATRQVVDLNPSDSTVTRCELEDDHSFLGDVAHENFNRRLEYLRRYRRDLGDEADTLSIATEYMTTGRALPRQATVSDLGGLADDEQQIINNLRTTRERALEMELEYEMRRIGSSSPRPGAPQSTVYPHSDRPRSWTTSSRASTLANDYQNGHASIASEPHRRASIYSTSQAPHDAWNIIERAMSRTVQPSREMDQEERDRLYTSSYMIPSSDPELQIEPSSDEIVESPVTLTRDALSGLEAGRLRQRGGLSPRDPSDPVPHTSRMMRIHRDDSLTTRGEIVLARQQRANNGGSSSAQQGTVTTVTLPGLRNPLRRLGLPASADIIRQRQLHGTTETDIDRSYILDRPRGWQTLHTRMQLEGIEDDSESRRWGVGTTGISCSADGRIVYVGTEAGIFELKLDYQVRKFWPAIEMR